jgi:LysR family transcriptional regulator, carnitine catabolism transcriptional activator
MSSRPPSPLSALTLRQVQHFVAVAHARSFTDAAQALSLTQPALTASIRQIEFLLGGPLFVRSARRVSMTDAGTAILPLAERLLNQAKGTFDDMNRIVSERLQTVRISFIPSVAGWLLPVLNQLREAHPQLRFALTDLPNTSLVQAISEGTADLGVGVQEAGTTEIKLRYEPLFEDEIVTVVRRDDELAQAPQVTWAQLAERDLAVFVRGSVSESLARLAADANLHLRVSFRMEYTEPLYALARNGLAAAVLPSLYTRHLHEPELVALRVEAPRVTRAISIMSLDEAERGPHVRLCREWITRHMGHG